MKKIALPIFIFILTLVLSACGNDASETEIDSYSYAKGYLDALESVEADMVVEYGQDDYVLSDYEYDMVHSIINNGMLQYCENAHYEYRDDIYYGETEITRD